MLLYLGIRHAFYNYIEESDFCAFLKKPVVGKQPSEEEFLNNWSTDMYNGLDISDPVIQSWYITSHFINQKQLNHLIGQFKNYITYLDSIETRASQTGNTIRTSFVETKNLYLKTIEILDFAKLNNSVVSNRLEDYFTDADDYARFLSGFIDFGGNTKEALQAFCNQQFKCDGKTEILGKYYDGMNPIIDRNIILASMYGNTDIASKVSERVSEKEIKKFKENDKFSKLLSKDVNTEGDLRSLRFYQNLKNRIELVDILSITELANDLVSHLCSYAYLRERDLMYMQLGFWYTKLFYTNTVDNDSFLRKLDGDCMIEDGAILYQITAMYSYDLTLYTIDSAGRAEKPKKQYGIGSRVRIFTNEYCKDNGFVYNHPGNKVASIVFYE